jgi:multimeric flavodoxin WrbA
LKVVAVNGSPRKKGNTQAIIDVAAEELRAAGIEVELISLADYDVRPCDGCEKCYKKPWDCPIKDDAVAVLKKMAAADGFLVGSPVYWGGVTAQLKALFDRSVMPYQTADFTDKVGGALTVGGGTHGGQELALSQINTYFLMSDMIVANAEGGFYGGMATGEAKGDVMRDPDGLKTARKVGKRMAHLLKKNKS